MRFRNLMTAAIAASVVVVASVATAGEEQWVYIPKGPDGPTAVFLDFTLSTVVLRFHCDQAAGELVLVAPETTTLRARQTLGLAFGGGSVIPLRTSRLNGLAVTISASHALIGRLVVTPKLASAMAEAKFIDVLAPNDMDEAWHVGQAEPLRHVVRACIR